METQEQKDERMALELFPDIPKKTKIREHVDAQFDKLTGLLIESVHVKDDNIHGGRSTK